MDDLNDLVWTDSSKAAFSGRTSSPFASSFDMLAGSTSSANRSYTSSPLPRTLTPSAPPQPLKLTKSPVNGAGGGADAFAGLFSLGGGSASQTSSTGLSLAQRQAKLAAAQQDKKAAEVGSFQSAGTFWDQFEGGKGAGGGLKPAAAAPARTSSALVPSPSPRPTTPSVPLKPTPSLSVSSPQPKAAQQSLDPWGEFDDLVSGPSPPSSTPKPPSTPSDPFDFLDQPVPPSTTSRSKQSAVTNGRRSGGRGDDDSSGLLGSGDGVEDDDDFMSAFNRPPPRKASPPVRAPSRPKSSTRIARPSSPPIHLVGQLVEMGFSPAAAREALASTDSGEDVETAAAILLSDGGDTGSRGGQADSSGEDEDEDFVERERQRKEDEEAERKRRRRQGPSRSAVTSNTPSSRARTPEPNASGEMVAPLQDLLATTNLLGQTVFNRANAFWSQSKQQVQKAYEERQRANASPAGGPVKDGRPKWMVDGAAKDEEGWKEGGPRNSNNAGGGFRDGDADKEDEPSPPLHAFSPAPASSSRRAAPPVSVPTLVEPEATRFYTSSRRHPTRASSSSPAPSQQPPSRPPSRQPSPVAPLKQRNLVSAPAQMLNAAAGYRTNGNDAFKLGQFGEAEVAYSAAIDILPDGHLRLVPLYNNRAAARLKNGDHSSSVADSTFVINLVGLDYDSAKEVPLPDEFKDLSLGDALVKAVSKRASALETGERWAQAKDDWELVGRLDSCRGPAKVAAMDGARRCKKMVDVLDGKTASPSPASRPVASRPAPKPKARSTTAAASKPPATDGASARLKEANATLESEEALRSELKDSVDGRVASWKTGKETNLRALIASLDVVLWPELGWQRVGLHELVTDKQVKVRYTRAIGKLHPDKLAVGATTVEQRMIAGAVFGILNEAWNASQN